MKWDRERSEKRFLKHQVLLLCGSYQQWHSRLLPIYGSWRKRQLDIRIRKEQKKVLYRIGICTLLIFLCGMVLLITECMPEGDYEGHLDSFLAEGGTLIMEYEDVQQEVTLSFPEERNKTKQEEDAVLNSAIEEISRGMLGNNPGWDQVSGKLYFPQRLSSGVYISYESSDPQRISEQGLVDGIGAEGGIPVTVDVNLLLGSSEKQYTLQCTVVPPSEQEDVVQALQLRAETLKSALKRVQAGEQRMEDLDRVLDGVKVMEPDGNDFLWALLAMCSLLWLMVLMSRFTEVEKQRTERKKNLAEEVPVLMDQLILMMNAGLILSEALEMAAISSSEPDVKEVGLCSDIRFLCRRAEETKKPVTVLLCEYAVETGCSELIRFSTMLLDHMNRGSSALIQQLKMERTYAMETQWKQKEGKCRQIEIRLSGPLILLLSVILLITIGPVMIGV